jgi:hypothetical protein
MDHLAIPVVKARPPMFAEMDAAFHVAGKRVLFAYGDAIYNPEGVQVTRELLVHESVHLVRQQDIGVEEWWRRYIAEPQFRADEELLAHRAEYREFCSNPANGRNARRLYLRSLATRLASALYGSVMTFEEARRWIRWEGPKAMAS